MEKSMALFLATLLHSGTNTHFMHWATTSYAQHKTLGKFYENIIELTDQLAEAYFGCYGQIKNFPDSYHHHSSAWSLAREQGACTGYFQCTCSEARLQQTY